MKSTMPIIRLLIITAILLTFPITAPAPPTAIQVGANDFYSQAGGRIPELSNSDTLAFDRGYIMVIDNPADFSKIISMDRDFRKGQKVMVKFTKQGKIKILMPDKKQVKIMSNKAGKWILEKTADRSAW